MSEQHKLIQQDFNFRTKDNYKRPTVSVELYVPTKDGLIALLQGEDQKVVELIESLAADTLLAHVRSFVDSDNDFSQETLNALIEAGEISLERIANLPKSERNTISKEMLEEFAKDYISVMPQLTGADVKKVQVAAGLFIERFKRVAGDNEVLAVLQARLGTFIEGAGDDIVGKHERVLAYLATKLEELLSVKVTADAL